MSNLSSIMPSGKEEHYSRANEIAPIKIAIISVSDTRTPETDINGRYLKQQALVAGMEITDYEIVKDEPIHIANLLEKLVISHTQVILLNGGTGLSKRDTTYDVISRILEKALPGFGEIFRMLSYEQVGPAAMLSRATAGVYKGKVIISIPGSPAAVQLAWEKLISPEIMHLAWEITR